MGNQASKVLDKAKDKKKKTQLQQRRRSTITLENRSLGSHVSHGNYDWIDQNELTTLSDGALTAALEAARTPSHHPASNNNSNSSNDTPPSRPPRRKSITEYFTKRRPSTTRPTTLFSDFDFKEFDRWQRQHYLLKSARKANAWAPFYNDGDKDVVILDVGTGNGIWALEMANQYPSVQVLGLDRLLPNDPNGPENLRFCPLDITESWPMSDNAVNFIFQRSMCDTIKQADWRPLLAEMYRVLKPGGYIELIENDFWRHNPGPVQRAFDAFIQEQCKTNGVDFQLTESLEGMIKTCGFEEIDKKTMDIPLGEWPTEQELKQFGFINKEAHKALLKNHKDTYIKQWGLSSADYDLAVQEVLEEFDEYHSFTRFHCWVARKPL
ncbi:S-adenosyl-L-methionine-dependent methyltransferase [Absidia repens]|uniref:S-adenosyl-L-methionine-dependent methyltransferase n=1 Tax=Absidia repens TaxID=90262 RepID=A0A1X2IQZ1_9FUNG|nr:S-adenosyl-L-methionine-dependent methyltransferase [Absidia repens]